MKEMLRKMTMKQEDDDSDDDLILLDDADKVDVEPMKSNCNEIEHECIMCCC